MSEQQLCDAVVELAQLRGWLVHHDRPARTADGWRTAIQGDRGFPDLVLARCGVVLFIELKSEKGKLAENQQDWLFHIGSDGADIWRPLDWTNGTIERRLR